MNSKLMIFAFAFLALSMTLALAQTASDQTVSAEVAEAPTESEPTIASETPTSEPTIVSETPVESEPTIASETPVNQNPNTNTNPVTPGNTPVEEESGNRRLRQSLPVEELSTPNNEEAQPSYNSITGAVVGLIGRPATIGIGILCVVLGVAGLLVYNRQRFGLVRSR